LHKNMKELEGLHLDVFIVSKDKPEQQLLLYNDLKKFYQKSFPFLSDPTLHLAEYMGMKHGDKANRGYGMIDPVGRVVFSRMNDHWGEQAENTINEIKHAFSFIKHE
jgi:alkyl hydroperoxide reductase subunit AhpC